MWPSIAALCCAASLFAVPAAAEDFYAPRDWSVASGGKMNISGFLFRDINRNGSYDLPDRPMEDIAVEMTGPRGEHHIQRTNSNGFANFSMSKDNDEAIITEPGDYAFDVIVPEGWSVTTGNTLQVKSFHFLPGAVGDMIADPPFVAVGLVQDLRVFGRLPEASAGTEITLDSGSVQRDVTLQADGSFSAEVEQGAWSLSVRDGASGATVTRAFTVTDTPVQLSGILFGDREPSQAPSRLVDFEDVTDKSIREMPNGVGGLSWWNVVALEVAIAYTNNAVSGHYVAYNSSGHPARIYHDTPFDFVGAYFGIAWRRANGETLQLRGWRGEELVYEDSIVLSYLGPIWFTADYRGITRLDLQTEHYWQFVTDDMEFRLPQGGAD
ncbi:MAG: hypothetical protein WDZ84_11045 [Rhodovibrionaceae bacterium]